jgi:hypothetical protein
MAESGSEIVNGTAQSSDRTSRFPALISRMTMIRGWCIGVPANRTSSVLSSANSEPIG